MHGHANELVTRSRQQRDPAKRVTNPAALSHGAGLVATAGICRSPPGPQAAPMVCDHHRGPAPERTPQQPRRKDLVMPHEPSGSRPPVQPLTGRHCPSCRTTKPPNDVPAAGGAPCPRRRAAAARHHRPRPLRQVTRRAAASDRALLAEQWGGGGDAA
jgi:hypothetical protein